MPTYNEKCVWAGAQRRGLCPPKYFQAKPEATKPPLSTGPIEAPGCAQEALKIIKEFNHLRGDLDAYLYDVAQWGLGEIDEEPNPEDFGL